MHMDMDMVMKAEICVAMEIGRERKLYALCCTP